MKELELNDIVYRLMVWPSSHFPVAGLSGGVYISIYEKKRGEEAKYNGEVFLNHIQCARLAEYLLRAVRKQPQPVE